MRKKYDLIYIVCFFLLNLFNTLFLSSDLFNRYIISFNNNFFNILFSFLGNFAILGIVFLICLLIFRKPKKIYLSLLIITSILNILLIILSYYTKGYKNAFSIYNFTLFRSPSGGFGGNVFLDWIYELFVYYRIIIMLPTIVMLIIFLINKKKFSNEKMSIIPIKLIMATSLLLVMQFTSFSYYFNTLNDRWPYASDYAQYGIQSTGLYNYYVSELVFHIDCRKLTTKDSLEEVKNDLDLYNKNSNSYTNFIDGKQYSNIDYQTGILKNKNIFIIQAESLMNFCINSTYNNVEVTPYLNSLIKNDDNCFYFNNAYTNIGIGNTSDAEFSVFSGIIPNGNNTIVWDYADYNFDMYTLGDAFENYIKYGYNGTDEVFYNHNNVHEYLYKENDFKGLDTFEKIYSKKSNKDKYFHYWISDTSILNWSCDNAKVTIENGNNSFSFVTTITPHNPFPDYSKDLGYEKKDFGISSLYNNLNNYMNVINFDDKLLYDFLINTSNPESDSYMKDTVYIIYGDHGNQLPKGAYDSLFNKKLSDFEYRRLLLNIPFIIYDPTGSINQSMIESNVDRDYVLSQVKSERDLFRTIVNLYGVDTNESYYGVNIFSGEPSFTYCPKNFDIITDTFMYSMKKQEYSSNDDLNSQKIIDEIKNYRKLNDLYLNTLVYKSPKRKNGRYTK